MITVSLNEIRKYDPCQDGWKTLRKAKGGSKADMGAQFLITDIIESNGFDDALWCLRARPEYANLWRKYAVWCARQVEHLMTDQRSRNALDVAWLHSEGLASDEELRLAARAAWEAAWDAREAALDARDATRAARYAAGAAWEAAGAAEDAAEDAAWDAEWATELDAEWDARAAAPGAMREKQKAKLIQILTAGEWVE